MCFFALVVNLVFVLHMASGATPGGTDAVGTGTLRANAYMALFVEC